MRFGNVYSVSFNARLSTAIYPDFVNKDCWNGRKTGRGLLTGSPRVESTV
jgi:hypothetical protein